jgi:hypothetical protein
MTHYSDQSDSALPRWTAARIAVQVYVMALGSGMIWLAMHLIMAT